MSRLERQLLAALLLFGGACAKPQILFFDSGKRGPADDTNANRPRLGDRFTVASTLRGIFGQGDTYALSADQSASLDSNVTSRISVFGGPCDIYSVRAGHALGGNSATASDRPDLGFTPSFNPCAKPGSDQRYFRENAVINPRWDSSAVSLIPIPTVQREGYRLRVCEELTAIDASITAAVTRIGGEISRPPTDAQLNAVFALFYVGQDAPPPVLANLRQVADAAAASGSIDAWRFALLTVCLSPGWQIY